jgi:hypothetical protein
MHLSMLPSSFATASAPGLYSSAAQWLACDLPDRRFAFTLSDDWARLGADAVRYSLFVRHRFWPFRKGQIDNAEPSIGRTVVHQQDIVPIGHPRDRIRKRVIAGSRRKLALVSAQSRNRIHAVVFAVATLKGYLPAIRRPCRGTDKSELMVAKTKREVCADQLHVDVVALAIAAVQDVGDFLAIGREDGRDGVTGSRGYGNGASTGKDETAGEGCAVGRMGSVDLVTGAMNRYPRLGMVSM